MSETNEVRQYDREPMPLNEILQCSNDSKFTNKITGHPLQVEVFKETPYSNMVPTFDSDFVFDEDITKNIIIGLNDNIPILLYGWHGAGKTGIAKNILGALKRPWVRIQHTGNMEESDILGRTLVRDKQTVFHPGVLPRAMRYGWTICLDEYDVPDASVLSVYQPVLEGEQLFIKEADEEWEVVQPHPDFRIIATGNTNGSGDDTGLYQGTSLGNMANYSRFGIACHVDYMKANDECKIIMNKLGFRKEESMRLVQYANLVRSSFISGEMSNTCATRDILFAGRLGMRRANPITGIQLAHINKLNPADAVIASGFAQRVWESTE